MTSTRRVTVSAWVLAAASLTVGCQSGDDQPPVPKAYTSTVFEHVTYPDGKPAGLLGDDPWVRTVYAYESELAWARAHYDWTSPQLTKITDQQTASHFAWRQVFDARDKQYDQITPAGPKPIVILTQRVNEHGTAVITACRASNWYIRKINDTPDVKTVRGNYVEYTVVVTDEGFGQVFGETNYSQKPCDISKAKVSYFDPLPRYAEPAESDFKLTDEILTKLGKPTSTEAP